MPDFFEHLLGEQDTEHRPPLGATGWTDTASLARKGHKELSSAVVADNPREASVVDSAVEEGVDSLLDGGAPEAIAALEALFPLPLDLVVVALDELIERRVSRPARPIQGSAFLRQDNGPPATKDAKELTHRSAKRRRRKARESTEGADWGALFVFMLIRFHRSRNPRADYHGTRSHASRWAEIAVAVAEGVLLVGFSIPLWHQRVAASPRPADALTVDVIAEQFAWNVHYPGLDGIMGRRESALVNLQTNPVGLDREDPYAADDIVGPVVREVSPSRVGGERRHGVPQARQPDKVRSVVGGHDLRFRGGELLFGRQRRNGSSSWLETAHQRRQQESGGDEARSGSESHRGPPSNGILSP